MIHLRQDFLKILIGMTSDMKFTLSFALNHLDSKGKEDLLLKIKYIFIDIFIVIYTVSKNI